MAVPVWATNQVLLAADVNSWFVPIVAYKTADTPRNTLTQTIDPDLQVSLPASATYQVTGSILYNCATAATGLAWSFTLPAGAGGAFESTYNLSGTGFGGYNNAWSAAGLLAGNTSTIGYGVRFTGILVMSTTPGTFGFNWAAGSGPHSMIVQANSSLILWRVG
jgi:hypothetical protein